MFPTVQTLRVTAHKQDFFLCIAICKTNKKKKKNSQSRDKFVCFGSQKEHFYLPMLGTFFSNLAHQMERFLNWKEAANLGW